MGTDAISNTSGGGWLSQLVGRSKTLFGDASRRRRRAAADGLYAEAVAQSRRPVFYTDLGMPDTQDSRLELVQLHVILLLRRLQRGDSEGTALGQALFDVYFQDVDRSLRESGVGDLSVGKWVKKIAQQFYARVTAVEAALAQDDTEGLTAVVRANVTGAGPSDAQVRALVAYLFRADRRLAEAVAGGTSLEALRFDGIDPIEAGSAASG